MSKSNMITSWSFSRYKTYKDCPLKAKLKFIDKINEPSNAAMQRGSDVHNACEAYIKGDVTKIPVEARKFSKMFRRLRKQYRKILSGMIVEDTWAFTKNWDETTWNDWANCWVRIKLDCAEHLDEETLIINDWKTGKFREQDIESYMEQLELYALSAMLSHKHINIVKPRLVYLDVNLIYPSEDDEIMFTRKDIPRLKKAWENRVKPMFNDKTFAPRPNFFCSSCFFRKSNKDNGGGQCEY